MPLVEAQLERGGRAHEADAALGQAQAPQVFDDGLDDVQHGQARGRGDLVEPEMRRIARDGDELRAGLLQEAHAFDHIRQGIFTAGHVGAGPVGNAGIVAQQGGDVLLVDIGGRQRREAKGEGRAGHGPHTAQYTQVTTLGIGNHVIHSEVMPRQVPEPGPGVRRRSVPRPRHACR
ncbi:hypothetical protein D9M68_677910 [compost metagenome]